MATGYCSFSCLPDFPMEAGLWQQKLWLSNNVGESAAAVTSVRVVLVVLFHFVKLLTSNTPADMLVNSLFQQSVHALCWYECMTTSEGSLVCFSAVQCAVPL